MKGNISVKIEVPENVDRLMREICRLDGGNLSEFYQYIFLDALRAYFDTGELFNLEGLAKIHGLHEAFHNIDTCLYGKKDGGES